MTEDDLNRLEDVSDVTDELNAMVSAVQRTHQRARRAVIAANGLFAVLVVVWVVELFWYQPAGAWQAFSLGLWLGVTAGMYFGWRLGR